VAINDSDACYSYSKDVGFELQQEALNSYQLATAYLNNKADLVCVQHEYGIFGGPGGSYALSLARGLCVPVVSVLHTVLRTPNPLQRQILQELVDCSCRVVVLCQVAMKFLVEIYSIQPDKIDVITHGVPELPFEEPEKYKDRLGLGGQRVLLTFGLLSPNKGIESVIKSLPSLLKSFPNLVYVVAGVTHPHVKKVLGECYRNEMARLARDLRVDQHVRFINSYLDSRELDQLMASADIYVSPHRNPEQIACGSLSYALGAGKAIVSTPYWYAQEVLADDRGVLVPFGDSSQMAEQISELLGNELRHRQLRSRVYEWSHQIRWANAASRYAEVFERAYGEYATRRKSNRLENLQGQFLTIPPLKLDHILRLTDDTGILQHAAFTIPNRFEGYCTDDNARALILMVVLEQYEEESSAGLNNALAEKFMAFLWHALCSDTGRIRNFLNYNRTWTEVEGSEESHARTLWALGTVVARSRQTGLSEAAEDLFRRVLSPVLDFTSLRAWSFVLLGIQEFTNAHSDHKEVISIRDELAGRLYGMYCKNSGPRWNWFEDQLTYFNARLPHALLVSGKAMQRTDMVEVALSTLDWLSRIQRSEHGDFSPIGNKGFYPRRGERARFDQQPIDAHAMVSASLEAYLTTHDLRWRDEAVTAFKWFLGYNDVGLPLYNRCTGGCRDGLMQDGVNQNEGAESTIAYLLARLEMRAMAPQP
jgi:glycosyltransferase involved in cell wall biosynthesis